MFEYILLKNMLSTHEFFVKTILVLESKYFTDSGCSKLIQLIKLHYIEYKKVPTMTELIALIKDVPNMELRKSIVEALKQINSTEIIDNKEFLIKETTSFIKDAIFTEALIIGSDGLTEKNEDKKIKAKALMEEMATISLDSSDLGLDFDDIETMIEYYQNRLIGILTQHKAFNKRIGTGFLPGTLSIIMAASGIGKCSLSSDYINIEVKNKDYNKIKRKLNEIRAKKNIKA